MVTQTVRYVRLCSGGDTVSGALFLPETAASSPAIVACHGAFEYKETLFELCEYLRLRGFAALALDMRGHGASEGSRGGVEIARWTEDVLTAVSFLQEAPEVAPSRIGAFGFSSGGTAVLEAALLDSRIRALVTVAATVRDTLTGLEALVCRALIGLGKGVRLLTGRDLRLSLSGSLEHVSFAADPEADRVLRSDPRIREAYGSVPFPGSAGCTFTDTISRVPGLRVPTLVLHGEEDRLDPPETARLLYERLEGEKRLVLLPEAGHAAHRDRHKGKVLELAAEWLQRTL